MGLKQFFRYQNAKERYDRGRFGNITDADEIVRYALHKRSSFVNRLIDKYVKKDSKNKKDGYIDGYHPFLVARLQHIMAQRGEEPKKYLPNPKFYDKFSDGNFIDG